MAMQEKSSQPPWCPNGKVSAPGLVFKGEILTYVILFEKKKTQTNQPQTFHVGLYSDNCQPMSFKYGMMIWATKFYILSVWMTLTFIQVTGVWDMNNFNVILS